MAFPNGSKGLIPWMNDRIDAGNGNALPNSTVITFPLGGNIVFRWIEDGTYPAASFKIMANVRWGVGEAEHEPLVRIYGTLPGLTTFTFPDRPTMFAYQGANANTAIVTSDNSYWEYEPNAGWIRMLAKVNAGTVVAYGVTATIYTATIPQSDIPKINNVSLTGTGYYDLCWDGNQKHAPQYDATFNIAPAGHLIWTDYFDRTELNSRVAGEKALFPDECVTAGQVEAGNGVSIKWRNLDGSLSGYATDPVKAGNLVIEANPNRIWTKHWWIEADEPVQASFTTQTAVVVGGFNVYAGAISFSGHGFWDVQATVPWNPAFVGTAEVVAEHSNIIDPATPPNGPGVFPPVLPIILAPPNNLLSVQNRFLFEGVRIRDTGCYLVHTVIQGISSPILEQSYEILPPHEHEMSLHYFVKRNGVYYNTYCLDHKNKYFSSVQAAVGSGSLLAPGVFSNKWSLQGTAILALEEGDDLFGQVAAISYEQVPGGNPFPRTYSVNYITQHIELLSKKTLTTNLYPHNNPWFVIQFFDFTAP